MKKLSLLTLLLTALLLSACGSQTIAAVNVDAMTLLSADDLKGDAPIEGGYDLKIPDDNGLDSTDLGVGQEIYDNLQAFKLDLTSRLTLSEDAQPLDGTIAIYIHDKSPVFEATNPIEFKFSLVPGESRDATLNVDIGEDSDPTLFKLLKSGDFKFGVLFTTTGDDTNKGTMTSELTSLNISLKTDLSNFTSF